MNADNAKQFIKLLSNFINNIHKVLICIKTIYFKLVIIHLIHLVSFVVLSS